MPCFSSTEWLPDVFRPGYAGIGYDINSHGDAVGTSYDFRPPTIAFGRACLWKHNSPPQDLGMLPLGFESVPIALNNIDEIIGECAIGKWDNGTFQGIDHRTHFIWTPSTGIQEFRVPPAPYFHYSDFTPVDINDDSVVLGNATNSASGEKRAMIWKAGTFTALNPLPGSGSSLAWKINNSGQILGLSGGIPVLWTSSNEMQPIKSGASTLSSVTDLTESGKVLGYLDGVGWVIWISKTEVKPVTFQGSIPGPGYTRPFAMNDNEEFLVTNPSPFGAVYHYKQKPLFGWQWCKVKDEISWEHAPIPGDPPRLSESGYVLINRYGDDGLAGWRFSPPNLVGPVSPPLFVTPPQLVPRPPIINIPTPDPPPSVPQPMRNILMTLSVAVAASHLSDTTTGTKIQQIAVESALAQLKKFLQSPTFETDQWHTSSSGVQWIWSTLSSPSSTQEILSPIPSYARDVGTQFAMALQAEVFHDGGERNSYRRTMLEQARVMLERAARTQ